MQSTDANRAAIIHGTYRAYNKLMCRCDECREAARAHMVAWRLRKFGDRTRKGVNPYRAVHNRLRRVRGKAVEYRCEFCGGQAGEWALDNASPRVIRGDVEGKVLTWSEHLDDYRPLCIPCHRRYDLRADSTRFG